MPEEKAKGGSVATVSVPPVTKIVETSSALPTIRLTVNGDACELQVLVHWTLAYVLREKLGLTGTKVNCDEGACGACTVLMDGVPTLSCMTLAATVDGKNIETIEGLASGSKLHPIQTAWIEEHGAQCGYCAPGFIMTAKALLDKNPSPTTQEIKEALAGNICRCGNYEYIVNAVMLAARNSLGGE